MSEFPKITPDEFWELEFAIEEGMPEWILPDVKGYVTTVGGEEVVMCRTNTMIFDFDTMIDEENGITYDFEWMSHIYIYRGQGVKPFWLTKPEHEGEELDRWNALANHLIDIDCDYRTGIPKPMDFEQFYNFMRGDVSMEEGLERICDETE